MRPIVFITGASSGIGAAAVSVFASAGYDVVLAARRKEKLAEAAAACAQSGCTLLPIVCDVNSDASVADAFAKVREKFGRLDVLVNNAGYGVYGSLAKTPLDKFRENMETNYFGVIRCTQAALPLLRVAAQASENRGKKWGAAIVMVSSFVGRRAIPYLSSYCATKFALEGLSEALRIELKDERISVSVVNPGVTQTDFVQSAHGLRPEAFLSSGKGMSSAEVARVILNVVKRPRRNVYLTGSGKMGMALQWIAPGVFDRLMLRTWRKTLDGESRPSSDAK
ncbi:MAG TPA: SDR family NAD(P)-dependent oxidoreductase [Planctomycetota bacterium]|nr:SDR family NAD(P)-dependent oxidoreductase [Planctomycetota bacterium]